MSKLSSGGTLYAAGWAVLVESPLVHHRRSGKQVGGRSVRSIAQRAKKTAQRTSESVLAEMEAAFAQAAELADQAEAVALSEIESYRASIAALEERINGLQQKTNVSKARIEQVATVRSRFQPS